MIKSFQMLNAHFWDECGEQGGGEFAKPTDISCAFQRTLGWSGNCGIQQLRSKLEIQDSIANLGPKKCPGFPSKLEIQDILQYNLQYKINQIQTI